MRRNKISYMGTLLFFGLGAGELLVIVLIILLLFGGRKIPELLRGLGKGIKSFKDEMKNGSGKSDGGREKED